MRALTFIGPGMVMKSSLRIVPLFCVIWATIGESRAQDAAAWKERFLTEAPRRWQDYLERGKCLQGTWHYTFANLAEEGKVYRRSRLEFKQHGSCALVIDQNLLGKSQTGTLKSINSRYGFLLRRSAPDKPWVLIRHDLDLQDGWGLSHASPTVAAQNWVGIHFLVNGTAMTYLPDVIKDADFSVRSAAPLVRDGRTLVRVEFDARPKQWRARGDAEATGWMPLREGWFLFDPERYWVLRECHAKQQEPEEDGTTSTVGAKLDYKEGRNGFPILTRIVRRSDGTLQGKLMQMEHKAEFDLYEQDDVPESEFTLSAFGIPEPVELRASQKRRWYLWAAGAGILSIILGMVFQWRRRRAA